MQIAAGFGGIALEIAVQRARILCAAELIFGTGKMIEPDITITDTVQLFDRLTEDRELLLGTRQVARKAVLLFLHPGDMRITEERNAIGIDLDDALDGIRKTGRALMWQPIDEIDIDALKPERAALIETLF